MKVIIRLPPAHGPKQAQVVNSLADENGPQFIWVACGTKFGKTLGASCAMGNAAPRRRQTWWRWIAPGHKQARYGMRYLRRMLPGDPFTKLNKTDGTLAFPSLDTTIEFMHGKDPETTIEGEAVHGNVLDEASKLEKQVFDSVLTTVTQTRGKCLIISTPRGRNWFYKGCMRAKELQAAALARGQIPREIFITAATADNPHVPREAILEAKRLLPDRLFRQYYLAEFLEDGAVFVGVDQCILPMPEYERDGAVESWIHPDHAEMVVVAGADWAKKDDYTVLKVYDHTKRPFKCVGFLRFHEKKYTDAVADVVRFLRRFKRCDLLLHDKTGLGEVIDDILSTVPGLNYRGITFTNPSKAIMANRLITGIERRELLLPNWPALLHEMNVFEVQISVLGTMRYTHPDGDHDDSVWATALAFQACEEMGTGGFEVKIIEDLGPLILDPNSLEAYMADQLGIDPDEGF